MVGKKHLSLLGRRKIPQEKKILLSPRSAFLPYQLSEVILPASELDMVKRQSEGKGESSSLVGFFFCPRDLDVSCPPSIVCFTLKTFEVIVFL